jgi:Secretion system C-terminal sorting domain
MKKILYILTSILLTSSVSIAQPWMPADQSTPVKLDDVIKYHKEHKIIGEEEENEVRNTNPKIVKEDKDYHFDRWLWYWQQHLDENGYIVPPTKTLEEWEKYKKKDKAVAKTTSTDPSNWLPQGPYSSFAGYHGIGRTQVVSFHPTDMDTYCVGTPGGGAWKTVDNGAHWSVLYNGLEGIGVSDIDYNPSNPNTMYLSTGDRDAGDTYSIGILKSTDGGLTWNPTGSLGSSWTSVGTTRVANSLIINPADTNIILMAANDGIHKSVNGGTTWTNVGPGGEFKQIIFCPSNPNVVYAASFSPANIFRSADAGSTWQQVTTLGAISRITLAVCKSAPKIVMAVVANSTYGLHGIFKSNDTGHTFTNIFDASTDCNKNILSSDMTPGSSSCQGQSWYDLSIDINPNNPLQVIVGGVNTWYSIDGGLTWTIANQWYDNLPGVKTVHADKHFHLYHPLKLNTVFECNDGGVQYTNNPLSFAWNDITNGMNITQFYRNAVSDVTNFAIGGAQDNGTKIVDNGTSTELTGGDGMECQMDNTTATTLYTATQYGNINISNDGGFNFSSISNNIPGQPDGSWITPYVIHPQSNNIILAGYKTLYRSFDQGNSWDSISPPQSNFIDRIALSYTNPDYVYMKVNNGSNNSIIKYSSNFGNNWLTLPSTGLFVSDIIVDPTDEKHIYATLGGYSAAKKVASFHLGQTSWQFLFAQLPNVPVNCIAIDSSDGTIYIGTDLGVFYSNTAGATWNPFNNNLPAISVTDLGINYSTNELWAATYGRGMWKSSLNNVVAGISLIPLEKDVITIAPNPNNGKFTITTARNIFQSADVTIRIIDHKGTLVYTTAATIASGKIEVNAGTLPKGTYIVEVADKKNIVARTKMVVLF